MKSLIITLSLLISFSLSARQYVQCADEDIESDKRIVINLDNASSTIFLTNGIHLPPSMANNVLYKIQKKNEDAAFTYFEPVSKEVALLIKFPKKNLEVSSTNFLVELTSEGEQFNYYCFSSLYP